VAGTTVGERILVHLSGFLRFLDAYECPADTTQDGIAEALRISRAHTALELKRLRDSGRVEERMAHVAGARTRRKVYFLLPAGQEVARRMRDHAKSRRVVLVGPEGSREVSGAEAIESLRREGAREGAAVQRVLGSDLVELARPAPPKPAPVPGRPFFGRGAELAALRAWLEADPRPVAAVVGVAGIGKSALLAKLVDGCGRPALLRGLRAHDDAYGVFASVAEFLARQGRRRLKAAIGRPAYDPVDAIAIVRQDLEGLLLVLDDVHACPAADGILRSLLDGPLMGKVLVASRSQPGAYDRSAVLDGRVLEMPLEGLAEEDAASLLASRAPGLPPGDVAAILRATRGHPLALEMFAASGLGAGAAATERYIVETVLDGLDDAAERLLRTFAVLRRAATSPEALGATLAQLRRLTRTALLQHRDDGYVVHDLVREFLLARLPDPERRASHAVAAAYWEGRGDLLEGAWHRLEAGDVDRAAVLLTEAGEAYAESARAGDLEACLLRLPHDRRPLRLLAETQMFLGRFEAARAALEDLERTGDAAGRLRARVHLGRIATRLGEYARAKDLLSAAAADAATIDPTLEAEALRALGGAERRLGELPSALAHLTRAAELLHDGSRERVRALIDLGAALIARGDLAGARARLLDAGRAVRRGSRDDAAISNNLAIILSLEGEPGEAAKAFERSADVALRTGEIRFASYALANAVENLLRLDSTDAAAAAAERALSLAGTIGDPVALSNARANLGLVLARRGEWAKAEEQLLGSVDLVAGLNNPYSLANLCGELAKLYEAQGRSGDAAPWRGRAEDLLRKLRGPDGAT
jgi:tetratricopeptide (TPR) repeat protein/DNA-binding MarR family transcriptional regulator